MHGGQRSVCWWTTRREVAVRARCLKSSRGRLARVMVNTLRILLVVTAVASMGAGCEGPGYQICGRSGLCDAGAVAPSDAGAMDARSVAVDVGPVVCGATLTCA